MNSFVSQDVHPADYTSHGATCLCLSLLLGVDFRGWWCCHLCLGVHVSLCPHMGHEPASGHRTCALDLVWHGLQVLRIREAAFPHCRPRRELSKLPSVPSTFTAWAGNTGTYLSLTIICGNCWYANGEFEGANSGKTTRICGSANISLHLPCRYGSISRYNTALHLLWQATSLLYHIHHGSTPACAQFSFTVKVFDAPTQE